MTTQKRVAVVEGVRTPFCKANGVFKNTKAKDLGAWVVRELLQRIPVKKEDIDELIFGNVVQPPDDTNIARILSIMGGLPENVPAFTVNRNCASGIESVVTGVNQILLGKSKIIIAGGCESMSNVPILFPDSMRDFLLSLQKAKTFSQKFKTFLSFRPKFLTPRIPEIKDPICGLTMGQTAEVISREQRVTRKEQDEFAFTSQKRASAAIKEGKFNDEIVPVPVGPKFDKFQMVDDGPRDTTMEALANLKPVFDKDTGQVTAGNSSQVTDGAAALLLMSEEEVQKRGIQPLGWITYSVAVAIEPERMGMGPVYAISRLLKDNNLDLVDIDLIEINEAFAAQIVALEKAFASDEFAKNQLGRDKAIGLLDREKLNVNGGAVALGHPVGATGTRLIITLLKELKRRGKKRGIATLCVGGGQGEAVLVEANI